MSPKVAFSQDEDAGAIGVGCRGPEPGSGLHWPGRRLSAVVGGAQAAGRCAVVGGDAAGSALMRALTARCAAQLPGSQAVRVASAPGLLALLLRVGACTRQGQGAVWADASAVKPPEHARCAPLMLLSTLRWRAGLPNPRHCMVTPDPLTVCQTAAAAAHALPGLCPRRAVMDGARGAAAARAAQQ